MENIISTFKRIILSLKKLVWKRVDFDNAYWYQCVDYARWYAKDIQNPIWVFWGSAYNWYSSWLPFKNTKWKKVEYSKGKIPPVGAIIFFDKTKWNWFNWHVAVVTKATVDKVIFIWQNQWSWNWDWIGWNAISQASSSYTGWIFGNVMGWYELP